MLQSWHANCYWILAFITLKHAWSVDSCPLGGALWGWPRAGGWQMEGCRWGAGLPGWPFHPHAVAHSGGRWRARQRLFVALVCTVYTHMCKFTSVLLDAYFARLAQQNHVYAWECIGWVSTCLVHLCSMMFAHLVQSIARSWGDLPAAARDHGPGCLALSYMKYMVYALSAWWWRMCQRAVPMHVEWRVIAWIGSKGFCRQCTSLSWGIQLQQRPEPWGAHGNDPGRKPAGGRPERGHQKEVK